MSGLPIFAGRTWPYSANLSSIRCTVDVDILEWRAMDLLVSFSTKCSSVIRQRRSKLYGVGNEKESFRTCKIVTKVIRH